MPGSGVTAAGEPESAAPAHACTASADVSTMRTMAASGDTTSGRDVSAMPSCNANMSAPSTIYHAVCGIFFNVWLV